MVMSVAVNVAGRAVFGVIEKVFVPATSAALAGSVAFASVDVIADRVGRGDRVPVGVDRVDGDGERRAGGLSARGAGLAGGGARGGGLAGQQQLELGEGAGVDRRGGARVRGHRAVVMSVAVNVAGRRSSRVTEKVFVPATSAAFAGSVALASVEVMPTVSVEVTRFQFASTALTVTLNDEPAVWAVGRAGLAGAVPGAAVSPGIRIWSFANAPALIVVDGLVLAVIAPLLMSVAVKVFEPAVFGVTEKVLVPATSAALAGSVALASVRGDPDGVGRGDGVPVGVDGVDGDVEGRSRRSARWACRSCRRRCRGRRSRRAAGSGASRTRRR